jgi:hypothetical protein
MGNQIEKMYRMRKYIVSGIFIGTFIAFCLFMYPSVNSLFRSRPWRVSWQMSMKIAEAGLLIWILIIIIFVILFWLYKMKLKKDASLREAVNDERVRTNWLKSYRFAFYAIVVTNFIWKIYELLFLNLSSPQRFSLPHIPWLTLFISMISVTGAFLYYNREAGNG